MARPLLLPHAPASVTSARRSLCSDLAMAGVEEAKVDDATLVLSELLSNALRHAASLPEPFPPGTVGVSWTVDSGSGGAGESGSLEIAVLDGGAQSLPRVARPSVSAMGGRGLAIVENVAAKWGTEVDGEVTTVWAALELPVRGGEWPDGEGAPVSESAPSGERGGWTPGCCEAQTAHVRFLRSGV